MNRYETSLVEREGETAVEAELLEGVAPEFFTRAQDAWGATRLAAARQAARDGKDIPEHYHWDWSRKAASLSLLAYNGFALECGGEVQGLMLVNTAKTVARVEPDKGKPLVYIEYVEAAPWNLRELNERPRYGGVGVRLFEAAVQFSKAEGFFGRVGLHSLPQAESFYESTCQMTPLGEDQAEPQRLCYFELTRENVKDFLEGGTP